MKTDKFWIWLPIVCLLLAGLAGGCEDTDHTCMKCNGTGRVRDKYGYYAYVTCPRCNGRGSLTY